MVSGARPGIEPAGNIDEQAPNLVPPPGNPRFVLFDGLRALAALSVFLGHTITGLYTFQQGSDRFLLAAQLAYQGVGIFFLISGFLLYRPFLTARAQDRPSGLGAYARRRLLRIVPAYWVALSLFLALGFVSGVTWHNWPTFYGFGQIYSANDIGHGIGVAWTLCIEVTFYAALPLLAWIAARLGRGARSVRGDVVLLVVLSVGSLAFRAHFHGFFDAARIDTLPGTFVWFALGMGLALLSVHAPALAERVAARPMLAWLGAAALVVAQHELILARQTALVQVVSYVLYGLVALCVLLPAVAGSGGRIRAVLGSRPLQWIGLVSYAVYLYHSVVIAQLDRLVRHHHVPARYPVVLVSSFALTCICAALSYYGLERPLMRLGRSVRRGAPPPTEPAEETAVAALRSARPGTPG